MNLTLLLEIGIIVILTYYYQFISKDHIYLVYTGTATTAVCLVYAILFYYESPSYYHSKARYNESRAVLKDIARFNGVPEDEIEERFNFEFEVEAQVTQSQEPEQEIVEDLHHS